MKTELFKKVYIMTELDLPKAKGEYIFGWESVKDLVDSGISRLPFDPKDFEVFDYLGCYDWYLQPIESDVNTPFFGNSGAKIPVNESVVPSEKQITQLLPVRARRDDAGHWYLMPQELVEEYNALMDKMYLDNFNDQDLVDIFESKFAIYRTGGDINNVQLYIKKETPLQTK